MLTISTFNIKNDQKNYYPEKTKEIIKYLEENNIDILNLQELYPSLEKDLIKNLPEKNYTLHGTYRYKMKIMKLVNEKTPVITNKKVLLEENYHLPHYPAPLKRVLTKVIVNDNILGNITVINTHLDFQFDFVKKRQLKYLLKFIKKEKTPLILTGDFNLKDNKLIFQEFIKELEKLGINHVKTRDKTLKQSKYHRAIDHIFYSQEFKLLETKIITTLSTSDHYPVLIKLQPKNITDYSTNKT